VVGLLADGYRGLHQGQLKLEGLAEINDDQIGK